VRHRFEAPGSVRIALKGAQLNRIYQPNPFHLYRTHPWSCGLWRYWVLMHFHEFGIAFANAWGSIMPCAHLYNAVNGGKTQNTKWVDLDVVIGHAFIIQIG
jgi:hypothetical protein